MDAARLDRIQTLFLAALDHPPEERTAFLDDACADDPALRRAVETYLAADTDEETFLLDEPLVRFSPPDDSADVEGRQVGPYRLVRLLGRGGMGAVYLAERDDVERPVALKLVRGDLADPAARQRFLHERRVLARLEHPGIARLYDVGVAEDGTPYFAMEVVDGEPLIEYCDRARLGVEGRLRIFERVGRAVQHAHQHFVVHRDLKPSNVLVTDGDEGQPQVKLLDFGIAKLLAEADDETGVETLTGRRLLTPAYAAPEQVTGETVTAATDVYSLGVMLYELLTGQRPYEVEDSGAQAVLTEEPSRPSTVVADTDETDTTTAEARQTTPDRLARRLRGDLDVICLKALQKDPERRYASAEAFVEDVKRHLGGLPVTARPDSTGYRLRKFAQRHRQGVLATTAAAVLLALVVGFYTLRLQAERDRAETEAQKAERVSEFLAGLFEAANPFEEVQGDTLRARDLLARGTARVDEELAAEPEVQAAMLHVLGDVYVRLGLYDEAQPLLERALTLRRETLGPDHPDVAESLHDLGWLHFQRGDYAAADSLGLAGLALRRRLPGEHDAGVARSLSLLGNVRWKQGRYAAADSLHRQALPLYRETLGADHPETAAGLRDLSHAAEARGDYEAAARYAREALAGYRRTYGDEHPRVAEGLNDLAYMLRRQGEYEAAERAYREALALKRRLLGDDHPGVAVTLSNLGVLLGIQGRYDETEPLLREALAIDQARFGDGHPRVANRLGNLAMLMRKRGDRSAALAYLDEALRVMRRVHGDAHPQIAWVLSLRGHILYDSGDYTGAERAHREALAIERRFRGEEHENVAQRLNNVAAALIEQGRHDEAEPLLRDALAIYREVLEAEHPAAATPLRNLGRVTTATGSYEEGERVLREALALQREALGADHPTLAETRAALFALYEAWDRPEEAAAYRVPEGE